MQPRAAPLDRSSDRVGPRFVRFKAGPCKFEPVAVECPKQNVPIGTAGIEAIEPVLPEIERQVFDSIKAEHRKACPQEPALPCLADASIDRLTVQSGEGIVR